MKKYLLLLALWLYAPSLSAQTVLVDSMLSDGIWRTFYIYEPANFNPATVRPLLLNLHGLGSSSGEQMIYSNFMPIADTAGFLMVCPQGLTAQGLAYWNVGMPTTPNTNDLKFLSSLIDTMKQRYSIEGQQVYATGLSMGGYMSYYLALHLNQKIAAVASVAGSIYPGVYAMAQPGRAVPALQIHGTLDFTVPYAGNTSGIPIDTLMQFWVRNNGCNPLPVQTAVPNSNLTDGSTATHYVWSGGTHGATCELFRVTGGGHTWPGSPVTIVGPTNQDFNASAEIWRFFRQYRLDQLLQVTGPPAAGREIRIHPNPATDRIRITSPVAGTTTIRDMTGRPVMRSTANELDVHPLPQGLYLVTFESAAGRTLIRLVKQ